MSGKAVGKAASRPEPPSTQQHLQALAGQAAADQIAQEQLPLGGALGAGQAEVDDLLLAVGAQAERDQHGPRQRAGAGLAPEHHAIQEQHPVLILQRPAMERGHRGIELLGHGAHGRRAERPTKRRQQGDRDLAGREPEHETGQDHAIDLVGTAGVGPHHLERAERAGARHRQLDLAELGQQVAVIAAIATIGLAKLGHALEVLVVSWSIRPRSSAPSVAGACDVSPAVCGIGGAPSCGSHQLRGEYPSTR